jgi:hypothetical protein
MALWQRLARPGTAVVAMLGCVAMSVLAAAPDNPLAADRWQHRPLVIVAPNDTSPAFRDLINRLDDHAAGFADRDMIRYVITPDEGRRDGQRLSSKQRAALVRAIEADPAGSAEMILVGKDGGVKMRAPLDTAVEAIFERIDRMPMRRREMQEDG